MNTKSFNHFMNRIDNLSTEIKSGLYECEKKLEQLRADIIQFQKEELEYERKEN